MKEKKPMMASRPKKTNFREICGFFVALILAVCYEFLSWVDLLRGEQRQNLQKTERTAPNDAKNEKPLPTPALPCAAAYPHPIPIEKRAKTDADAEKRERSA